MAKEIIQRVYINKSNNQKLITIPKESGIEEGDFVRIEKMEMYKQKKGDINVEQKKRNMDRPGNDQGN